MAPARPGLDTAEAARRLEAYGPNALAAREGSGWWTLLSGVVREPMFALLIGASAVYFLLGDLEEAVVLAASILGLLTRTVRASSGKSFLIRATSMLMAGGITIPRRVGRR